MHKISRISLAFSGALLSAALLAACGYGGLYVATPYECFILMCILSEDPLSTYCDVWEMSYLSGPEAPEKRP